MANNTIHKQGNRILRAHDRVKVLGERGLFTIVDFPTDHEVHVWGGRPNHEKHRTFEIDRIGTRKRKETV